MEDAMQLHTISNYNQLRLNPLKEYEADKPYAYVDTEGIATIGIGLNLQVHGRLMLQALGFDLYETQLIGAALQVERHYINDFIKLFNEYYPPNNKPNNKAL